MTSSPAPIAVFAYRRTDHLEQTLDALERCPEFSSSEVFVFSDGPRSEAAAADVAAVRAMLKTRARANMTVIAAETNKGLAASITAGVTRLCDSHGRVIVIEDDLIVHPDTLTWFNTALDRFRDDERVWQVSGYQFDVPAFAERTEGLFLNLTTSWGWATWKRAWDRYDPAATGWERLAQDPVLRQRFDLGGAYPYAAMLERQMAGKLDSWAIRWWWTVFVAEGMAVFPPRSLVRNIGDDVKATHLNRARILKLFKPKREPGAYQGPPFTLPETLSFSIDDETRIRKSIRGRNRLLYWFTNQ